MNLNPTTADEVNEQIKRNSQAEEERTTILDNQHREVAYNSFMEALGVGVQPYQVFPFGTLSKFGEQYIGLERLQEILPRLLTFLNEQSKVYEFYICSVVQASSCGCKILYCKHKGYITVNIRLKRLQCEN